MQTACYLLLSWQWWELFLQSFLKDSPLAVLWFWDCHMLLFASPVTYAFGVSSFYCCRSEANVYCIVNKLLHLVCLFRKMCHALFALKGSSYRYFREHRWEKHACVLLDYIFQAPSLFGDCDSILFNILCSISDYIVFLSMLLVLEYVSISLIFSEWKLHAIPRSSWNVSFHWAWRIQSKLHENSELWSLVLGHLFAL